MQKEGAPMQGLGRGLEGQVKVACKRDDRGRTTGSYVPRLVLFRICCSLSVPLKIPISRMRSIRTP